MTRLISIIFTIVIWTSLVQAQVLYSGRADPNALSNVPANSVGVENSWYLDLLTGNVYGPKTLGKWPPSPITTLAFSSDTYPVTTFGLTCDGTTNDTPAWNRLVTLVNTINKPITLIFPGPNQCVIFPGAYTFNVTVSLVGLSGGGIVLPVNQSPASSLITWSSGTGSPVIQNLTVNLNSATATGTNRWAAFSFLNGLCPTVNNSVFTGGGIVTGTTAAEYMIIGTGLTCLHITNNSFSFNSPQSTNNQAVLTYGPATSDHIEYLNNTSNSGMVNFATADNFIATGNTISNWGFGAAIEFGSITTSDSTIKHGIISNNIIHDSSAIEDENNTPLPGIESGYNGVLISNNRITKTCGEGIDLYGQGTVSNNYIADIGTCNESITFYDSGIGVRKTSLDQDPSNSTITNNTVLEDGGGHTAYGYSDSAAVTGVGLGANTFEGLSGTYNISGRASFLSPQSNNKIVNPCFSIDQRTYGASNNTNATFFGDQWRFLTSHSTYMHVQSRVVVPNFGQCPTASKATVDIQTTPGVNDFLGLYQNIAAQDLADFAYGEGRAKVSTLSWCVSSSIAPPYTLSYFIQNYNAAYESYVGNYTVTAPAGQLQCFNQIIAPDPNHVFGTLGSAQIGAEVGFDMGSGSGRKTSTLNQWTSGQFFGSTTSSSFVSNPSGSIIEISNVRWMPGLDNGWVTPTYNQQIANAQRFYRSSFSNGTTPAQNAGLAGASCVNGTNPSLNIPLMPPMIQPGTLTTYNPSASNANWRDTTASSDLTPLTPTGSSAGAPSTTNAFIGSSTSATGTDVSCIHWTLDGGL